MRLFCTSSVQHKGGGADWTVAGSFLRYKADVSRLKSASRTLGPRLRVLFWHLMGCVPFTWQLNIHNVAFAWQLNIHNVAFTVVNAMTLAQLLVWRVVQDTHCVTCSASFHHFRAADVIARVPLLHSSSSSIRGRERIACTYGCI